MSRLEFELDQQRQRYEFAKAEQAERYAFNKKFLRWQLYLQLSIIFVTGLLLWIINQ